MFKIKKILYILLLSCLFIQPMKADDFTTDDSCTAGVGLLLRFVDNLTTFGLFEGYSENFHMYGAPGTTTNGVTDGYTTNNSTDDSVDGCSANYYPDEGSSDAYMHNATYCQSNGTNCCPSAINPLTGTPYPSSIGTAGGCSGDCNPSGGVGFCYEQLNPSTNTYECAGGWTQSGFTSNFFYPPAQLRVISYGGSLCIQFATNLGYQSIGCKALPNCTQNVVEQNCAVAPSCYSYAAQYSLAMLPITGAIMQCINDTMQYLFYGNPGCTASSGNNMDYAMSIFSGFQAELRGTVRSALILYIILAGINMVLSTEHATKTEFFNIAAKFILVLYFSTGININDYDVNGQPYYDDGIHKYMLPLFTSGASELVDIVYSSAGSTGICAYDSTQYPNGYGYLSMWDSLDCRILFYFGVDLAALDITSFTSDTVLTPTDLGTPVLLYMLVPAFLSFQLLFLVFSVVFVMLILSILVYFLNISVISVILVGVLIYLAPIFVPMALFQVTKSYYDSWLRLTISYALQPMIVAAYIAMMFVVFDQSMFGDCVFQKLTVNFQMDGITKSGIPFYSICDPNNADNQGTCYDFQNMCEDGQTENCYTTSAYINTDSLTTTQCASSIGYYINPTMNATFTNSISAIFFSIIQLNSNVASDTAESLMTLCLFAYLFYKFADVLGRFAAELTGGDDIGASAGSPMAIVNKVAEYAKAAAKAAVSSGSKEKGSNAKSSSSNSNSKPRSNAKSSSSGGKKPK